MAPTPIFPPSLKRNPTLRLQLHDLTNPTTTTFLTTVQPADLLPNAIDHIIRHLYHPHGRHNIPSVRSITLILRSMPGVAYTTGLDLDSEHKEIHVSLEYLSSRLSSSSSSSSNPKNSNAAFRHEVHGVITHEAVHCFQHDARGSAPGGLIEGIADYVRLKAGLAPPHWHKGSTSKDRGDKWDAGYQKTAWFLEWLEEERGVGVVSRINQRLGEGKYVEEEFWEGIFGKSVKTLWGEYRASWEEEGGHNGGHKEVGEGNVADEAAGEESAAGERQSPGAEDTEPEMVDLSLEEKRTADLTS
jgi:hypothetical protein